MRLSPGRSCCITHVFARHSSTFASHGPSRTSNTPVILRSLIIRLTTKFVRGYVSSKLQAFLHICLQLTDQLNPHRYTLNQLSKTKAEILVTDPIADVPIELYPSLRSAYNSATH